MGNRKVIFRLLVLCTFGFSFSSFAQYEENGMEGLSKDLFSKIQKAQNLLSTKLTETKECQFPEKLNCSAKSLCDTLEQNSDSLYLYKNDEGKGIPNVPLMKMYDSLEGCFKAKIPDPTANTLLDPKQALKDSSEWQKEQAKAEAGFKEIQDSMARVLEKRKNGKNNKEIDNMIRRIRTVKFAKIAGQEVALLTKARCSSPNAAYNYNDHTIIVCPQLYSYPSAAIANVLAHELAHSIDPCIAGAELKQSSAGLFTEFSHEEKKSGKKIGDAIPYEKNPFKNNVIACLSKKESMNLKIKPLQDLLDEKTVEIARTEQDIQMQLEDPSLSEDLKRLEKEKKELPQTYRYQSTCLWMQQDGETQESFADWMAVQVLKQKLTTIKDAAKAKQYAFESEGIFLSYACSNVKARVLNKVLAQFSEREGREVQTRCYEMVKLIETASSHPDVEMRVDRLHLSTREMQKALNCTPTSINECQ